LAERAVSVRDAQTSRVEERLALKFASGAFVEERVQELNFVRRRAHHLKEVSQNIVGQYRPCVVRQGELGELRVELDAAFESGFGAGFAPQGVLRLRERRIERVE